MDRNDPRLKHGIHVRARCIYEYGGVESRGAPLEGWLIDPTRIKSPYMGRPGWPTGTWMWGYVTRSATFTSATFTKESWERQLAQLEISGKRHMELMDDASRGQFWLGVASFQDMEYLDAGFSGPVKPKHRRGKRHRMRGGL